MTPQGSAFGIGRTTCMAINNLKQGAGLKHCGLTDEYSNGNGALMRILPMAFYCFDMDEQERFDLVSRVSALTHAHPTICYGLLYLYPAGHRTDKSTG
ncbi:MAG: ADP-ribosylglycohydrolase family protein [Actinomycetota bacterium]|nr:ADP-ribosylglycohydrolase family protein [Actinomycetota bacterium]